MKRGISFLQRHGSRTDEKGEKRLSFAPRRRARHIGRLKRRLRPFWQALQDSVDHDGIEHAGYLAFLFLLAFFPFVFFMIALTGKLGRTDIAVSLTQTIIDSGLLPYEALDMLRPRVNEILTGPPHELLTLAVLGAIWTASSLLEGLRTVFNRAHRVETPPAYIWRRLMSIGQFLLLTGALVAAVALLILAPGIIGKLPFGADIAAMLNDITSPDGAARRYAGWLRFLFTGGVLFCIVTVLYMTIPNMKIRDMHIIPGALACVTLWFLLGKALSLYLHDIDQVQLIYGSLGGIIAALFFFYLSAMALIYGAELNYHLRRR